MTKLSNAVAIAPSRKYQAILFDLLTALLDSWSMWNETAGSEELGRKWRAEYLKRTYGCGSYRPYETLVLEAAESVGLNATYVDALAKNWARLAPWSGVVPTLTWPTRGGAGGRSIFRRGHLGAGRILQARSAALSTCGR